MAGESRGRPSRASANRVNAEGAPGMARRPAAGDVPVVVGAFASGMARFGAGLGALLRGMTGPRPRARPIHRRPVAPLTDDAGELAEAREGPAGASAAEWRPSGVEDGPGTAQGGQEAAPDEGRWTFLDVAGRLAHEVRNPLTSLEMSTFVLADAVRSLDRPDLASLVAEIADAGRRIELSVDELLEFSRVAAGTMEIRTELIRPVDVADQAVRDAQRYRPGGVVYREVADRLDVAVRADPARMRLVLRSLARYLLDYGQPPVCIAVSQEPGSVVFRLEDAGPGLSREEQLAALERLHAGPAVGAAFGAGLGLFVCLPIVEAHEGTLEAEELPGGGTAFVIRIPLESAR